MILPILTGAGRWRSAAEASMTRLGSTVICICTLVWLQEAVAAPLGALRSIWVIED